MEGVTCCYCGRGDTLESRDNYIVKDGKRKIRIRKSEKFNIYWCYKCKRHCLELTNKGSKDKDNAIQKTVQDSE